MALLFAIILILSGALFFALQGLFGRFPDNWEWVGIILAVVGIAMGVQPFLKMWYGNPKLEFRFDIEDTPPFCFYECHIFNVPITNKFLRKMGVRRDTAQDVSAAYEILKKPTGEVVCPSTTVQIKTQTGVVAQRIVLPASYSPSIFAIFYLDKNTSEAFVARDNKLLLPMGSYYARVTVVEGEEIFITGCNFTVDDKHPFVYWGTSRFYK